MCVVFAIVSTILFSTAAKKIKQGEYDTKNPMTERILGMHFRYHTRICIFDGWRPPLHDPAMVLGMFLNGGCDPLCGMDLEERVALYHAFYPTKSVTAPCACSLESRRNGYFTDPLWKTIDFKRAKDLVWHEVWEGQCVEDNNRFLAYNGLPFACVDTQYNRLVNLETGDTVHSGSQGSRFV